MQNKAETLKHENLFFFECTPRASGEKVEGPYWGGRGEAEEDERQGGVVRELPEYTEIQAESLLSMQV